MAKLPAPPSAAELAAIPPDLHVLAAATELWRVYFRAGRHPTLWRQFRTFGPVANARFDHHREPPGLQQCGVLYCAMDGPTCVAEVFQDTRVIDRRARLPWLAGFALARDVITLDLRGSWPTRAGASQALVSGPRRRSRAWARAIQAAYAQVEGLLYPSSMRGGHACIVLFERAADAMQPPPFLHRGLDDPILNTVLVNTANDLGYGLL